jgi:NitT/TauT family transport system ATP-binding protein
MRQRVGIARALVAQPEILCLDEAFSALDILTAENLRREVISLWQSKATNVKSVFMVTHNIEEAVEMATQIFVLFPRPGHIGLHLENKLPYPRSPKSEAYQRLVSIIHDSITHQSLPDLPSEPAPAAGKPISRARSRMESIPHVSVSQVVGLLGILHNNADLESIFEIGWEIEREFGETIAIVKAAEILEFVETPKNNVAMTALGHEFYAANQARRTEIFCEQINKLKLFHIIIECLKVEDEIDEERILKELSSALPYDNPERLLQTMIAWGRYARILDYDRDARKLYLPKDDSEVDADAL